MNDRTRHSLAVLLFLVFGPTLTAALVGWVVVRRSPLAVQYETNALRAETGIDLKIDSVDYRRQNSWKYGQVELSHPNTGQPFVVFSELENRLPEPEFLKSFSPLALFGGAGKESFRRIKSPSVSIALNPKTVPQDVAILGHLLLNQFGDRFSDRNANLLFDFSEVEIRCPESPIKLMFVGGRFRSEEGKILLECSFNMQDNQSQDSIHFVILRQKNGSPEEPELIVELRTNTTEVPVRFLALLFPGLKSLGPEAFFHGTVRGELSKRNIWTVTFDDMTIENADLKTLAAELTPYRLSGQLRIGVKSAKIAFNGNQSRFLEAVGDIRIVNGSIERKLLARLVEDWQLSPTPNNVTNPLHQNRSLLDVLPPEEQDILFAEVPYMRVILGKDGALIQSTYSNGIVIAMDQSHRYHRPERISQGRIPYSVLLDSFSPDNAVFFPLTPQTQKIVPYLSPP